MNSHEHIWTGVPVTLVGMGRSAVGAAALLQRQGALPFVSDAAGGPALSPWCAELDQLAIPYEVGGHTDRAWSAPEMVVVSPGVPPGIAPLKAQRERGIPVIGELELAFRFAEAPIIAVTGTNGKTTVTELIAHTLRECGYRVALAGNNHTAFSTVVGVPEVPDYYVLEVSSYQLESVATFRPWIGAVLNLTPDHLGRHGTMEGYGEAKAGIFGRNDSVASFAVLNSDDERVSSLAIPSATTHIGFSVNRPLSSGVYSDGEHLWIDGRQDRSFTTPIPGLHNRANTLAALAVLHVGGFDLDACMNAIATFPGVEHRLEYLGEVGDRIWYNDSKSTNIDSLRVALESFDRPVTLLAGGQGKGSSYVSLLPLVEKAVARCIAYGAEGPTLVAAFDGATATVQVDTLSEAVQRAYTNSAPGETILLSPGCASFDQYENFEARGAHFKELVAAIAKEESVR